MITLDRNSDCKYQNPRIFGFEFHDLYFRDSVRVTRYYLRICQAAMYIGVLSKW
jgi:hypothetical protein